MPCRPPPRNALQQGVVLIEALIAILLFCFGLLALIGLQATLTKDVTQAGNRSQAALLANELIGQAWIDRGNLAGYAMSAGACSSNYTPCQSWRGKVLQLLPTGSANVAINGQQLDITLNWQLPGEAAGQYQISAVVSN